MFGIFFRDNIYIKMVGGLGNQLFIYAFGIATSIKYSKKLIIDNVSGFSKRDLYNAVSCLEDLIFKKVFISYKIQIFTWKSLFLVFD